MDIKYKKLMETLCPKCGRAMLVNYDGWDDRYDYYSFTCRNIICTQTEKVSKKYDRMMKGAESESD